MSILNRILGRETRAAETVASSDPYLAEFFGHKGGARGYVDAQRASGLATAHACISIVSGSLASVPLPVFRRSPNGGRDRATDHPLYTVLHDMANGTQTAFEAREYLVASLMVSGNAYARIVWNARGQVSELHPLDPSMVTVERLDTGRLRYRVTDYKGALRIYLQEEMLHLRDRLGRDGVMGMSRVQVASDTFNLALVQGEQANTQADNAFRQNGAFIFPNPINSDKKTEVLDKLAAKLAARSSTSGIHVLDGGVDFKSLSFNSRDSEFLESRKLTNLDICRIFGVPPTVAGILDHGTYSNVESESRALVVRCLAPMAKRIEQAMCAALLTAGSRKAMFIEHDLAGLLRGDLKARYDAYRIGREWGWLSTNEIRGWENLPDVEKGNEYLTPLNMRGSDEGGTAE